ncbi:hypothetical protein AHiyo6_06760 [Arthrobacter sp. Hiyo6]|nr:hypothetical protein AHiyo6_06760 [Arthrobacter sp. Hiyo6]
MTSPRQRIAVLPDSPNARLLAELTSHASDLSEASHTLACAFAAGEGSELWGPLTSHAATAYIRPFIQSSVRSRLDEMTGIPAMPPALKPVHDVIRKYRNTTIAHSQSTLAMPLPVAILNPSGQVEDVMGISLIHPMPRAIADQFSELISAMEDVVECATQPVKERLRAWLKEETPERISRWQQPEVIHRLDSDFTGDSTRKQTPQFTLYWHLEEQLPGEEQPQENLHR